MFVVDTNILLYAADQHAPEHETARRLVEAWRRQSGAWYVTWGIVYEFLRVATHPRVFRQPWSCAGAWEFIEALLSAPSLRVLSESERHAAVVRETLSVVPEVSGNLVFDMHTAVLMKEHGVREIYTRDMDFHRFPFLSVVDPIAKAR